MPAVDVAKSLGVTESRVSQLLRPIKKAIEDAAILSEVMDDYRDDPEFSKLEVEWITI